MASSSSDAPPPEAQDYASQSKWRHQESSKYSKHAGPHSPPPRVRPADDREDVNDLADFLNASRLKGSGPPFRDSASRPATAGARSQHQPIIVDEPAQGDARNVHTASGRAEPGTQVQDYGADPRVARQRRGELEDADAALGGLTDGREVRCGPLLNYRRMEGQRWFGSVLMVVRGGYLEPEDAGWVPELVLRKVRVRPITQAQTLDAALASTATPRQEKVNSMAADGTAYFDGVEARVKGVLLYADLRNRFWRFSMDLEMEEVETQWAYEIPGLRFITEGKTDRQQFWVPSVNESMRIMFHSCNGFSVGTDEEAWSGPALWNDVQRVHKEKPFHVMIGGGDQIYNDGVRVHGPLRPWTNIANPKKRRDYPFPETLRKACDDYYVANYVRWYSTEPFAGANGQIPQLNVWDDHDIIDGFGSYVKEFMECDVFRGIGGVAYKYYLLFQHHLAPPVSTYTTDAPQTMTNDGSGVGVDPAQTKNTYVLQNEEEHPSYIIGHRPGPYVAEHSRSIFTRLGARIAFFGLDGRTERTRHQVNYPETYQMIYDRVTSELARAAASDRPIHHLVVLLGIPIAYPRLTWLENVFSSPLMGPIKFLNKRFGFAGSFINKFDGSVDLLDDLDDHYTARTHKRERHELVSMLQDIAATYSVRVTILSGDVHLAAVGRFYSNPSLGIPVENDYRYMANVVSSAIVNKPPPSAIANLLAKRNRIHHFDADTDETLLKMFDREPGAAAKKASWNKVTMPSRNWAMITECTPSVLNGAGTAVNGADAANAQAQAQYSSDNGNLAAPPPPEWRPRSALPDGASARSSARPSTSRSARVDKKVGFEAVGAGEAQAGTTSRAADMEMHGCSGDGALDVAIRVERDQHDATGRTQAYGLFIPSLNTGRAVPRVATGRDWEGAFGRHYAAGERKRMEEEGK